MVRALYSAVSGLTSEQTEVDIIGANISNSDTVGYKDNDANLSDSFSQIEVSAGASNPEGLSVGLGSQVLTTTTDFSQGAFQQTNVSSDLGIQGDGFFTVQDGSGDDYVTRAGNFITDSSGYLRTPDGYYVMGVAGATAPSTPTAGFPTDKLQIPTTVGTATPPEQVVNYSIGTDGSITVTGAQGTTAIVGYVTLQRYSNDNGLTPQGDNLYTYSAAAGTNQFYQAGQGGAGTTQSGVLELSNVDLATEFSNMIVAQRSYDADSQVISTVNEMLQTLTSLQT